VLARVALLVVALAAAGWLASAYPGARDEARAKALMADAGPQPTAAERERALALLRAARRARPDGAVILREAALLITGGRREEAARELRRLLGREPESVSAWALLVLADPAAVAEATARRRALAPRVR
jgi:predicted Zn-dependent protease